MKRLLFVLFVVSLVGLVLAQSAAQIGDIKGRRSNAPAIRTAFEAIATGTKTVTGVWTISGDWIVNGAWEFNDDLTLENDELLKNDVDGRVFVTFDEDSAYRGELVLNQTGNADPNDHFDWVTRMGDGSGNMINWARMTHTITDTTNDSKDSQIDFTVYGANTATVPLALTTNTMTLDQGATITNPTADTLSLNEKAVKIKGDAGLVFAQSAEGLGITKITQFANAAGAERIAITIGGVDYLLVATADSADIVD